VGILALSKFAFRLAMRDGKEAVFADGIPCSITISAMRILSLSKHGWAPEGVFPDIILQIMLFRRPPDTYYPARYSPKSK
jgi:hypothetical protein